MDELDEEIRLHIELRIDQLVQKGWTVENARAEAWRRFGNVDGEEAMRRSATRTARRMNVREWLGTLGWDIRYGARQLRRNPGFATAAILVLALGIGANTAMFSFVDALLLRPPDHVIEPERVVHIYTSGFSGGTIYGTSSYPDFEDFRELLEGATEIAAFSSAVMTLDAGDAAELIDVVYATPNYFDLLGVRPAAGRLLGSADADASAPLGIVLGYDLWQRLSAGTSNLVGHAIRVNGQPLIVVGVAPRGFRGPGGRQRADAFVSFQSRQVLQPSSGGTGFMSQRDSRGLQIVGRLARGTTVEEVGSRLAAGAAVLHAEYPDAWTDVQDLPRSVVAVAGRSAWLPPDEYGEVGVFAGVLMGLVALVLLIACTNVANLLLVRATKRRGEIAVRVAIGATRGRLVRQLVTESLLLACAGAVLGVLLAPLGISALRRVGQILPIGGPFGSRLEVGLDPRVLVFAVGVSALAALLFGLAPAFTTARRDPVPTLKDVGASGGRDGSTLRALLVGGQVTACVVILVCSSVLVRNLREALDADLGFEPSGVLLVPLTLSSDRYGEESGVAFYQSVREQVAALPGVQAAALGRQIPLGGRYSRGGVRPEGYQPAAGEDMEIDYDLVSPGFFDLVRTSVVRGRPILQEDRSGAPPVAVVSQAFADRFWPGQDPLGKRLRLLGQDGIEVVGVAPTAKVRALNEEPRPIAYLSVAQFYREDLTLHVRAEGDPEDLVPAVRARLRELDAGMPIANVRTFEDVIAAQTAPLRLAGMLFTGFGLVTLTIAMIGLYSILAYAVAQRTREIGIRLALGASAGRLARGIVARGMALVLAGVGTGLAVAWFAVRPLEGILIQSGGSEGRGLLMVVGLLAGVSLLAILVPASRATRIDPMLALRDG